MNPHLAKDRAHEAQQERDHQREVAIQSRALEILSDPHELDVAIGDQVDGAEPFEPERFIQARAELATAKLTGDVLHAAYKFKRELEQIAHKQAEAEIDGRAGLLEIPAFLRRQAE